MKKRLHLKILLFLSVACLGNGLVYGQQAMDIQLSYDLGEPFLINTFDVDQVRVLPIKG